MPDNRYAFPFWPNLFQAMTLLSKIERFLGRFAVPNLAYFLVAGQVAVYVAILTGKLEPEVLVLVPRLVMAGQWWRIFAFLLMPPPSSILFIAFAWWMFCLMGSALETFWGTFRFNLFVLLGSAFTVGLSFLIPDKSVSNAFLAGSVFLAFAHLNPDFELALFFILPVKIKWLALGTWLVYGYEFIMGGWSGRLQIVAAVGNFLIFFGRDIASTARYRRRQMLKAAKRDDGRGRDEPRHRCHICGKTELSNPELDFRYCSKCAGDECYCSDHIRNHEHVVASP
jgi:hypothetical protein